MAENKSEFGKGLTYCIGLFLEHAGRAMHDKESFAKAKMDRWPEMWFNGSSDHLYELVIDEIKDEQLKAEINDWQEKVLHWGHGFSEPFPKENDVWWSIKQAKKFLQEIDEKMLNTKTIY